MIDNNHLVYVGVLTLFLIGATTVALIGSLLLAAGNRNGHCRPGEGNIFPPAVLTTKMER